MTGSTLYPDHETGKPIGERSKGSDSSSRGDHWKWLNKLVDCFFYVTQGHIHVCLFLPISNRLRIPVIMSGGFRLCKGSINFTLGDENSCIFKTAPWQGTTLKIFDDQIGITHQSDVMRSASNWEEYP